MDDFLIFDSGEDGIVTWTMNRPESRNALAGEAQFSAIEAAVARANADPAIRVVILTGAGPAFCAGGDVKDMVSRTGMFAGAAEEVRRQYRAGVQRIPRALETLEVPLPLGLFRICCGCRRRGGRRANLRLVPGTWRTGSASYPMP